jgi:hypothetical protein
MPNPPANPEQVKASFLFWLLLTTNPFFENYYAGGHPPTLQASGWDPANLPASLQQMDPTSIGTVQTILNYLATTLAADGKPYWVHFQAVQEAYQKVMNAPPGGVTGAGIPPTYTAGDPYCPKEIVNITGLVLTYP